MTNITLLILMAVYVLFTLRAWQWGVSVNLYIAMCTACFSAWRLRTNAGHALVVHVAMIGVLIAALGSISKNGGITSVTANWLFVIPLISGLLGGASVARYWAVIVAFSMGGLIYADVMGWELRDQVPAAQRYYEDRIHHIMQYVVITVVLLSYLKQVGWSDAQLAEHIDGLSLEVETRQKAEEEACRANQAKTDFLASMSHEFRTPLNSVIGFSQRLLSRRKEGLALNTERDDYSLEGIRNNGKLLLRLINELLDLSKLESGNVELKLERLDVEPLLGELVAGMQGMAREEGVFLNLERSCSAILDIDTTRFSQIILNVISNGIKYGKKSDVLIACDLADHDRICFSVTDHGDGIADEDLPKLFDPYTNINHSRQEHIQSTGLGLSLCKRLVDLHGGSIEVETVKGEGSCFRVYLPLSGGASA